MKERDAAVENQSRGLDRWDRFSPVAISLGTFGLTVVPRLLRRWPHQPDREPVRIEERL